LTYKEKKVNRKKVEYSVKRTFHATNNRERHDSEQKKPIEEDDTVGRENGGKGNQDTSPTR